MSEMQSTRHLKQYFVITLMIAAVTLSFSTLTTYLAYPTTEHRAVGQQLAELQKVELSLDQAEVTKEDAKAIDELSATVENTYTTRMSMGAGFLSVVISVAVIAALYRYLRRNDITDRPVFVTVFINTVASTLVILPSVYITKWITGIPIDSLTMIFLILSMPLAIGFTVLFTFFITKMTERHYNRSNM